MRLSRRTPLLGNIRPSGAYLMEDLYYAGGVPAVLERLRDLLALDAITVNGRTIGENIRGAGAYNDEVIAPRERPLQSEGGLAVLRGNLAPEGAIIKSSAAEPRLLTHTGPAVVFRNYADLAARIDDPDLVVTADSVLVLQHAGPQGGPGMPEWGMLPIPKKLLQQGVRDMVRVSDARMSGTAYGACVLHVSPESFVGGPLALVQDGDPIELNVPERRLTLQVAEGSPGRAPRRVDAHATRVPAGYGLLFMRHVTQAHEGCDFDFLHRGGVDAGAGDSLNRHGAPGNTCRWPVESSCPPAAWGASCASRPC